MTGLIDIPLEAGKPLELARRHSGRARAMVRAAEDTFGLASRLAARAVAGPADRASRDRLVRRDNPYPTEIGQVALPLGIGGLRFRLLGIRNPALLYTPASSNSLPRPASPASGGSKAPALRTQGRWP